MSESIIRWEDANEPRGGTHVIKKGYFNNELICDFCVWVGYPSKPLLSFFLNNKLQIFECNTFEQAQIKAVEILKAYISQSISNTTAECQKVLEPDIKPVLDKMTDNIDNSILLQILPRLQKTLALLECQNIEDSTFLIEDSIRMILNATE